MPVEVMDAVGTYVARFDELKRSSARDEAAWASPLRKAAISRFAEMGFPTTRDEDWRHTNVKPIVEGHFDEAPEDLSVTPDVIAPMIYGREPKNVLVFVNGRFAPSLSTPLQLP